MAGPRDTANISGGPANTEAKIQQYCENMKNMGRAEETVTHALRHLKQLSKEADLTDPEKVKSVIANKPWSNNTKRNNVKVYAGFLNFLKIQWIKPTYYEQEVIPFIPTEAEIDHLIGASSKRISALLQIMKETGARVGEVSQLQWRDIDAEHKTVNIKAEKGSHARILPISDKLLIMLSQIPRKADRIFPTAKNGLRTSFSHTRKRVATKLQNPRILQIHFHTLRHWKGTMEYHKTKDCKHVQRILGHKNSMSTDLYINIEQALWLQQTDIWTCRVAHNETEAIQLIEAGFQYVNNLGDTCALYKKLK